MNNRYGSHDDVEQEKIGLALKQDHEDGACEGHPLCWYCLDEWEEANREELEKEGYYDWNNHWRRE